MSEREPSAFDRSQPPHPTAYLGFSCNPIRSERAEEPGPSFPATQVANDFRVSIEGRDFGESWRVASQGAGRAVKRPNSARLVAR